MAKTITPSKARNGNGHAPLETTIAPQESDLAKAIREDGEKRRNACAADIEAALKKHRCAIGITPVVQIEGRPIQVVLNPLPPG